MGRGYGSVLAQPLHLFGLQLAVVAALSATLLLVCSRPVAAQTAPAATDVDEPRVVIWRSLRNDFHDRTLPVEFVNEVVTKTPPAFMTIQQGETVSGRLQKSLNISATWTPTLYQQMIGRIVELNRDNVQDIDKVPAGARLLVPQVPTVGKKLKSTFANNWLGRNIRTGFGWINDAVARTAFVDEASGNVAPQEEVQYFSVPLSQAGLYKLNNYAAQGASGPVTVELAQELAPGSIKNVLSPDAAKVIRASIAAAKGSRPILVIVDDSIPDNGEYAKSKALVLEMSRVIRKSFALGDSPFVGVVESMPDSMIAEQTSAMFPNLRTHASLIKQSLQEFDALDPTGRVSTVYLPLGATQVGVAPLMHEIVYLAQVIKTVRPALPPARTASAIQIETAKMATDKILASNTAAFKGGVLMPLDSGDLIVTTDSLYLEALGIVLSYYADASRRPYVMSFSWSVKPFTYPTLFEVGTYGIKFAAAGNQRKSVPGLNFLEAGLEYASRAANSRDFVAVMNSTATVTTCPSNFFDDTGLAIAGVAYPGEVTGQYCGTSFSTPRAAWLAAARDASIGQTLALPVSKQGKLVWVQNQHNAILALKQTGQPDIFGRYTIDVTKYFAK